jgi:RimJ/RimL family protein N-acetyltransferase
MSNPHPTRSDVTHAHLAGRDFSLRPVEPDDMQFLYQLSTSGESLVPWRFRGTTPSPEGFHTALWQGVMAQFIVVDNSGAPRGLVTAYNSDARNGTVWFAMILDGELEGKGSALEAAFILFDYLFTCWPFRKIYIEAFEFNAIQFGSAVGRLLAHEGHYPEHEFHAGRFWSREVFALYRPTWEEKRTRYLRTPTSDDPPR